MEEPWNLEFVSYAVDCLLSFVTEFVQDWAANDMRVSIFKILLGWLLISLVSIHFAWKVYGITVNDMYHRQGTAGQNGGTPETATNFSGWESSAGDGSKPRRE
ncbi:T-cell leukemia translocation-altered gene protein-like protein [Huso huso]|uniref:T-cell leukemia translocation-altered gene protein homolog n=2 Tax=Acipenseridae TaxID=7900 RepID=A0ABR0Z7J1_HUSHU|nr:T-cell leukemia translocation-altered gene protein homolog isoform X1 [Acipenser ruthenus]